MRYKCHVMLDVWMEIGVNQRVDMIAFQEIR